MLLPGDGPEPSGDEIGRRILQQLNGMAILIQAMLRLQLGQKPDEVVSLMGLSIPGYNAPAAPPPPPSPDNN